MKILPWANLAGILLVAALCVVQWRRDRQLNLEINRRESARQVQEAQLSEQRQLASGLTNDLAHFKEQFNEAHADAREARLTLRKIEQENAQLSNERDQLQASVTNWVAAVRVRDETLRDLNLRLTGLGGQLQDSILKFNMLATNYNASVTRFNELATNYNSVVTQLNETRGAKKKP